MKKLVNYLSLISLFIMLDFIEAQGETSNKTIFIYAGNMGVAQGVDILIDLVMAMRLREDVAFLFIGRGTEMERIRNTISINKLNNILLLDEISTKEMAGLFKQCHFGLVALDRRHKTQNIPGRFMSYIYNGLPVLCAVNKGNEIVNIVKKENIGAVTTNYSVEELEYLALKLANNMKNSKDINDRCKEVAVKYFSTKTAVTQVLKSIKLS